MIDGFESEKYDRILENLYRELENTASGDYTSRDFFESYSEKLADKLQKISEKLQEWDNDPLYTYSKKEVNDTVNSELNRIREDIKKAFRDFVLNKTIDDFNTRVNDLVEDTKKELNF